MITLLTCSMLLAPFAWVRLRIAERFGANSKRKEPAKR